MQRIVVILVALVSVTSLGAIIYLTSLQPSAPAESAKVSASVPSVSQPVAQLNDIPQELLVRDRLAKLFQERAFSNLTTELEQLQKDYEADVNEEQKLYFAFSAFELPDPLAEDRFNAWVKANPKSFVPHAAACRYFFAKGFQARGNRAVSETSEKKLAAMTEAHSKALPECVTATKLNVKAVTAYSAMVGLAHGNGYTDVAERVYGEAVRALPGSYYLKRTQMVYLTPRWGGSYQKMQKFAEDNKAAAKLNYRMKWLPGFIFNDQGLVYETRDDLDQAVDAYSKAIALGSDSEFFNYRSRVFLKMKRTKEARDDALEAVKHDPYSSEGYVSLLRAARQSQNWPETYDTYRKAALTASDFEEDLSWYRDQLPDDYVSAAYRLEKAGDLLSSEPLYNFALSIDPKHAESYHRRSLLLAQRGKLDEAATDARKFLELAPDNYDAVNNLDWVLAHQGKWEEIAQAWTKFIATHPNSASAYFERSGTYHHMNNVAGSIQDLKKACSLGLADACDFIKRKGF